MASKRLRKVMHKSLAVATSAILVATASVGAGFTVFAEDEFEDVSGPVISDPDAEEPEYQGPKEVGSITSDYEGIFVSNGGEVIAHGNVTVVHATYDPETKSGSGFTGRKVKGTIHWVNAATAIKAEVRLYENIVDEEKGVYNEEDGSVNVNPNSLTILNECYLEPSLKDAKAYDSFQFVRQGYFTVDSKDSTPEHMVFNRIVSLKSSFRPGK